MNVIQIGSRVIALACAEPETKTVDIYGAGIYAGEHPRPGHEDVPVEGSDGYLYWAAIIQRSDDANSSLQWSLDMHKQKFEQGEFDEAEYELRCAEARDLDELQRAVPMSERVAQVFRAIGQNPRIDLDEGGSIWGFECWWGLEDVVTRKYEDWTWVPRSIEEDRLKYDQS
jgi:hypothetical protein